MSAAQNAWRLFFGRPRREVVPNVGPRREPLAASLTEMRWFSARTILGFRGRDQLFEGADGGVARGRQFVE